MIGRKSALWLAAAISVLAFAAPAANGATDEQPCNGSPLLCGKTLDQVVLPGTHNSMSNEQYDWALPNQHYSIPTQLAMGIRAFLIDTHYGKLLNGGPKIQNSNRADSNGMYLCHEYCQLGSTPLVEELAKVKDFLAANPREVLIFVNQAGVTPDDFAQAVTDAGLLPYVYTGSTDSYPTLQQMIDANQRVVMLSEGETGDVPWYHDGYAGPLQETPYEFHVDEAGHALTNTQGMDLLTNEASLNSTCRPNRGGETGALFLMNHWVNGLIDNSNPTIPDPEVAKVLNARDVLVNRARACEARRGKLPNIVAVDDFGDGDLIGAVNELNGIPDPDPDPDPEPEPIGVRLSVKKPGARKVKAGRVAIFRVKVVNSGDTPAQARLCATPPKRLARRPRCVTFHLGAPGSKVLKLKVHTKGRARGKGKVRFVATAAGKKASNGSTLVVKQKRKARKHKIR